MVREQIYTGPGGNPTNFETDNPTTSRDMAKQGSTVAALATGLLSSPALIADFPGYVLRGMAKVPSYIDAFGAEMTDSDPIGRELAMSAEKAMPQDYFTKKLQDAILLGNREEIAADAHGGETPFMLGALAGNIGGMMGLAAKSPKIFNAVDIATDWASATPSRAIMEGAKTVPQMIGAGATVGLTGSVFPALDMGYNAQENKFDPMAAVYTMGGGAALGAGIPAVVGGLSAIPKMGKTAKNILDEVVQGTTQMIKQSDNNQVMKQMSERNFERQKMQEVVQQQEAQVAKQYEPEPVKLSAEKTQEPQIERTFAKETFGYEGVPDKRRVKLAEIEGQRRVEIEPHVKEIEGLVLEKQAATQARTEAKTFLKDTPDVVKKKFDRTPDESIESRIAEKLEKTKIDKDSYKKSFDAPDPKVSRRYLNAKGEGRGVDDIAREIALEVNPEGSAEALGALEKEITEKIGRFTQDNPTTPREYYRKREQQALDVSRQEAGQVIKDTNTRLPEIDSESEQLQGLVRETDNQYKQMIDNDPELKEYLPAVIERVPPARFIGSKDGVLEVNPQTGEPIPMKRPVEVNSDGNIVIKESANEVPKASIAEMMERKGVDTLGLGKKKGLVGYIKDMKTVGARVYKASKTLGNKLRRSAQDAKFAKRKMMDISENIGLNKALSKYQNDDEVMATLGNVVRGGSDENLLPPDLLEPLKKMQSEFDDAYSFLKSAGYRMPKKAGFYFPFEVKDLQKLREINQDADSVVRSYLDDLQKSGNSVKTLDDLTEVQRNGLNQRLEQEAVVKHYTPEMMKAYKSMPEALNDYTNRYAQSFGDVTLFGGKLDKELYSELIPELILSADDIAAKDIPIVIDNISKLFAERDVVPTAALKLYQTAIATLLVTGSKTLLAQMTSAITNVRKSGLLSTVEGGGKALEAMVGKAPSYTRILNPDNTMQNLNDVGVDSFKELKDYIMSNRMGIGEKSGKGVSKAIFAPLQFVDRWAEKEVTFQANLAWMKNNVDKSNFKIFEDRYASLFEGNELNQLKTDIRDYRSGKLKDPLSSEVLTRAVDARAGEQLVLSPMDRSAGALGNKAGNEGAKAFFTLQSFAQKLADEIDMNTRQMITEGIKEGNSQKVRSGVAMGAGFVATLPAFVFANDLRLNGNPDAALDKANNPRESIDEAIRQANPVLARTLDAIGRLSQPGAPSTRIVMDFAAPGSGSLTKIVGDTASTALQGKNPYSVEDNPSAKYLPPRILMEHLYEGSDRKARANVYKQRGNSTVLKRERLMKDVKYAMKHGIPVDERIDTPQFKEKLNKYKDAYSRAKRFGTLDREKALKKDLFTKGYHQYKSAAMAQIKADIQAGRISQEKAQRVINNLDSYIMKKMEANYKKGKL